MEKGLVLGGLGAWVVLVLFFRSHRNWLPYYILGSVGLAFLIIGLSRWVLPVEPALKEVTALAVNRIGELARVETQTFDAVPGVLMVLVTTGEQGWTIFNIGVESSGLLEMAVIVGIVGFFPGWSWRQRAWALSLGLLATFIANVVRISFIVAMLHWVGKDALFISHTVLGRLIFAVMVTAIFVLTISFGTLRIARKQIQERLSE